MWNYFLLPKTWSEVCVRNWEAQDPLCPWLKTVFSLIGKHWGSKRWKKKYFPRSNQINIGLKCLPPVLSLREAILAMNDSRISRDGLEKLQALFHLFLYSNKLIFFWKVFLPFLLALSKINQNHQALAPTQEELTAIRSAVAEVKIFENTVRKSRKKRN